jgi:predicted nucleotidyltransferase
MIKEEYKQMILKALEYHFPGAKVYLFGSRAWGTPKPGSDIDLAIDAGNRIVPREVWRAKATFENLFIPFKVDVVDLNAIPKELRELILEKGIVWKSLRSKIASNDSQCI